MIQKIFTKKELPGIAQEILAWAISDKRKTATVIALSGDLGAGKTTLTQSVAQILGVRENIISPTFVIMKKYALSSLGHSFENLIHIDAYRLNSSQELLKLGWQELLEDKANLIIVEWPEQVPECMPEKGACRIKLSHIDEETRGIEIML